MGKKAKKDKKSQKKGEEDDAANKKPVAEKGQDPFQTFRIIIFW